MQRDYMKYVDVACKEGMKPEEVQNLLNEIERKANNKGGKRVLRLFAKGIAKVKKNSLINNKQQQFEDPQMQNQIVQEKSYQYILK